MPSGIYKPEAVAPNNPPTPFRVFISSDTDEFADLRRDLRDTIDSEYMYNNRRTTDEDELVHQGIVMKAVLVEAESAESFDAAMKRGLAESQIYVGIFGRDYSEPTIKEYRMACDLGLPLLIYYFARPPRTAKSSHGKVVNFLKEKVKRHVPIRGNYSRIEVREERDLIDLILVDLACKTTDLVREAIAMRQMLLKAPDDVNSALVRAQSMSE